MPPVKPTHSLTWNSFLSLSLSVFLLCLAWIASTVIEWTWIKTPLTHSLFSFPRLLLSLLCLSFKNPISLHTKILSSSPNLQSSSHCWPEFRVSIHPRVSECYISTFITNSSNWVCHLLFSFFISFTLLYFSFHSIVLFLGFSSCFLLFVFFFTIYEKKRWKDYI